jgi:hypothetical protein
MLSPRRRFGILLVYVGITAATVGLLILPAALNMDINVRDPLFFDRPLSAQYLYHNGTEEVDLKFTVTNVGAAQSTLQTIIGGSSQLTTTYTHTGSYVDPSYGTTTNQSIFWIHIVEAGERSEFADLVGKNYTIYDPVGIIGVANTEYNITISGRTAYWPEEAGVHGAQASLLFEVYSNNIRIGKGLMDLTCGMIFTLDVGGKSLKLIDTDYDISRNRLFALIPVIILVIAAPFIMYAYIYLRKKYRNKEESKEDMMDSIFLAGFAAVISAIDIYNDVWMYATLGFAGNMILRLSVLAIGAVYSLYRGYHIKWIIPGILEFLFVGAISLRMLGDSYAGHLTAAMGMTISLMAFIWMTGNERTKEAKKLDAILTNLI